MNTSSVNSVSSIYVRTAVAQQRVAVDRGNVRETEAQLSQYQAKLDEDLTYLAKLQRKSHDIQQLEGNQAQTTILDKIEKEAQSAQQASERASTSLSAITGSSQTIGTNINIVA